MLSAMTITELDKLILLYWKAARLSLMVHTAKFSEAMRHVAGARAFALDVRSKRRWETPDLSPESITAFKASCQAFGKFQIFLLLSPGIGTPVQVRLQSFRLSVEALSLSRWIIEYFW